MRLRYTRATQDGENKLSETIEVTDLDESSAAIAFREFYRIIIMGKSGLEESVDDSNRKS